MYSVYIGVFLLPIERQEHPENKTLQNMYGFIYGFLICIAFVNGFAAALMYVAQSKYLSECASDANKGSFVSFFKSTLNASYIVGNLMAAFVIVDVSGATFYI